MVLFLMIVASSSIGQAPVLLLKDAGHSVLIIGRDSSKITPDFDAIFKQAEIDGVVKA